MRITDSPKNIREVRIGTPVIVHDGLPEKGYILSTDVVANSYKVCLGGGATWEGPLGYIELDHYAFALIDELVAL